MEHSLGEGLLLAKEGARMKIVIERRKGEAKDRIETRVEYETDVKTIRNDDIGQLCHLFAGIDTGWVPTADDQDAAVQDELNRTEGV